MGLLRVALLRVVLRRVDALLLLLRVAALLVVFLAGHCSGFVTVWAWRSRCDGVFGFE